MRLRRRFLLDVESTSTVDLRAAGAHAYWEHPETRILCVCYRVDDGPVIRWRPDDPIPYFATPEINDFRVVAHNYLFEYACWHYKLAPLYGWTLPRLQAWDCTMARALYWGLPAGLGDACDALVLPVRKDASARPLMLRMSRPRSTNPTTWWDQTDPLKLAALIDYCEQDVLAECALDDALPELPAFERDLFLIDGRINLRGVQVDLDLVDQLADLTQAETHRLNHEMVTLTGGRVRSTSHVLGIKAELASCGWATPDLTKETITAELENPVLPEHVYQVLACRQEAAKASTAKLRAIQFGANQDLRCRGLLQYGGAGRTMRWAGRRAQPQNFPRGTVPDLASVYPLLEQNVPVGDLDALLPGTVMDGISSALRGCFVASPGNVLVSGDLAQIEARVLCWLAGQDDVLDVFARGEDVYRYTAGRLGSTNRQFGKVLVLACGFGMGPPKFQATAKTYGIELDLIQAHNAVHGWRDTNAECVKFWWDVDFAFRVIAKSRHGTSTPVGKVTIRKTRRAVRIVLPSTHELIYQNVELTPYLDGGGGDGITFMGVGQKTKRYERQRTYGGKLVENIVQAVARDVMGEAMRRVHVHGVPIVLTVHDELLTEAPAPCADVALRALLADMTTRPAWAPDLPVSAEGWTGRRYRK